MDSCSKAGKTSAIYSLLNGIIIQLTLNYKSAPICTEYVRKTVVNSKLQSQPWKATVSVHKIAQLLLNIVTFSHDEPRCSVANQSQGKM